MDAEPSAPAWLLAGVTLSAAAVFDVRQRRIPNRLIAFAAGAALLLGIALGELACALAGAAAAILPVGLPNLVRPGSVGAGDVKLAGVLGGFLGVLHVLFAVAAGVAAASAYLALSRTAGRIADPGPEIPLAPFLFAGLAVTAAFA